MSELKALRYNHDKVSWSLVDFKALEPLVQVLQYGKHKYTVFKNQKGETIKGVDCRPEDTKSLTVVSTGANNWKLGLDKTEILESLARHLFALFNGEENDPESGLPHIGHLMCNAMFWSHFNQKEKTNNNAPVNINTSFVSNGTSVLNTGLSFRS